jgi:hypothetical protein
MKVGFSTEEAGSDSDSFTGNQNEADSGWPFAILFCFHCTQNKGENTSQFMQLYNAKTICTYLPVK